MVAFFFFFLGVADGVGHCGGCGFFFFFFFFAVTGA